MTSIGRLHSTVSSAWRLKRAEAAERRWCGALGTRFLEMGQLPEFPVFRPEDAWPGTVEAANALFRGRYDFGCGVVEVREAPWHVKAPNEGWLEALHSFCWLRHFAASPTEAARRHVRALVRSWLDQGQDHPVAWRPAVTARRLVAWAAHAPLVLEGGDEQYRLAVMRSARRASGYLSRTAPRAAPGLPALVSASGLIHAGLVLPGGDRRYRRGMQLLQRAIEQQILPDGGHATRNPAAVAAALAELAALRRALLGAGMPTPSFLLLAIDRLAPMLRFFRHEDGRLALFNGATEMDAGELDRILALSEARGRPFRHAPHTGYFRLRAGNMLVLMDAGRPPAPSFDQDAHAGCLAFEMSSGDRRLIVNCGDGANLGSDWRKAARVTAAHSTLSIGDESSCAFRQGLLGSGIGRGPRHVAASRRMEAGCTLVEAEHDGYAGRFGMLHRRRLFVGESGDIRGEDLLLPATNQRPRAGTAHVRFHLHPDVIAEPSEDGGMVLRLPSEEKWQFRARGGAVTAEESVYIDLKSAVPTRQIVVTTEFDAEGTALQWALRRAE